MSIAITKDDISQVIVIMNSREDEGIYGCIDRKTGEVLIGSQDYPLKVLPDEEDENFEEMEAAFNLRYLWIPQEGSREAYQDMVSFIETVEDGRLQDLLEVAIQGRGAFSRFKDILRRSEYESELNRWQKFSDKCEYDRAIDWLTTQGFSIGI